VRTLADAATQAAAPAACHISKPIPVQKRSIVHAHEAHVRAAIRWLAFVNQSVIRQHAARHAAMQARVDNNRKST